MVDVYVRMEAISVVCFSARLVTSQQKKVWSIDINRKPMTPLPCKYHIATVVSLHVDLEKLTPKNTSLSRITRPKA